MDPKDLKLPQSSWFPVKTNAVLPKATYHGKVVVITGGGTGLGKSMAERFSELGAQVAILARRLPVLEEAAKEISSVTGNPVIPVKCDIRDAKEVSIAVDKVIDHFGIPDVVVHNAAGNFISPTERLSPNAFKTIIDIVLMGTVNLTLEIGKRMIDQKKGGVFLAISTTYAREGSGFVSPSACAKSGVETLMKSLGSEWGRHGIRMNCIAPGPIYTEGAFSRLDPTGQMASEAVHAIPVGRMGNPAELANLATFICSDYASFMNSESILFDGGEYHYMAGEFNQLSRIAPEQWDAIEKMIRETNRRSKSKL